VDVTAREVRESLPKGTRRIVVPVGSGMSLAGILWGTLNEVEVVGVVVGADPLKRLDRWAPPWWHRRTTLVRSDLRYEQHAPTDWRGISLDPVYEAKCVPFLRPGDLFWVVGRREEGE
jgi:1-aminocyclopropane-1-carboxylate deaminase/D-cysteine desulfhydrase-like pyridoxal-dependent ACC family enzyme